MKAKVQKDKMGKLRLRLDKTLVFVQEAVPYGCPEGLVEDLKKWDAELKKLEEGFAVKATEEHAEKIRLAEERAEKARKEGEQIANVRLMTGKPTEMGLRGNKPSQG